LEQPKFKTVPPKFDRPFPKNGADDIAKLAMDVRRRGGCPIFVLTPLLPESGEIALWQNELTRLWREIDEAGLHNIMVEDSTLWSDPTLFDHDESGLEASSLSCTKMGCRAAAGGSMYAPTERL
jgi:hypothetical protein